MKILKKIKRAIKGFVDGWNDVPKIPLPKKANIEDLDRILKQMEQVLPMNPHELLESRLAASVVAKKAHDDQTAQINDFLSKTFRKRIPEYLLQLYGDTKAQIPGLETRINYFLAVDDMTFGRHVMVFYQKEKIGDARFTAFVTEDGKVDLQVQVNM